MSARRWVAGLGLSVLAAPLAAELPEAIEMARQLAEPGPRPAASVGSVRAAERLRGWMAAAGLEGIEDLPAGEDGRLTNLTGVLPGRSGLEIVLTAHYDTVAGSPGAADDAAGCAVVLAAASALGELPRRHTLRVVLYDGEETGLAGSRSWVSGLGVERRRAILGLVNVDRVGWNPSRSGVARLALAPSERGLRLPPAWLVHAVVRAGVASGDPVGAATSRWGPIGQLQARAFAPLHLTAADSALALGIPAVTLTEADPFSDDPRRHPAGDTAERLDGAATRRWVGRLTAVARRLDAMGGRPRDDDQYLVVATRVMSRRDLYWANLIVWISLVLLGLPGRWRGEAASVRWRRGRSYLPGFTRRLLYLAAILMLPVFTTVLLLPAAVLAAISTRVRLPGPVCLSLAMLPPALFVAALGYVSWAGRLGPPALGAPALLLLAAGFAALVWPFATAGRPIEGND
jgi:hypothetical protein